MDKLPTVDTKTTPGVQVHTKAGVKTLHPNVAASPFASPDSFPLRLRTLVVTAAAIMCTIPDSSARALAHAESAFFAFLNWAGATFLPPAVELLVAFIVLRCTPPVDTDLPAGMSSPVLPTTAVSYVDALRRLARKGNDRLRAWLPALESDLLYSFCREVGGRVKKLHTMKRPLLFKYVMMAWTNRGNTAVGLRNATSIVVGFFYGCRVSELIALNRGDITLLPDGVVRLRFRQRKNRRTILGTHDPQVIHAQHDLLTAATTAWLTFLDARGATEDTPLFPDLRGQSILKKRLSADTFRNAVKAVDPLCVTHSLRVGMATEAWAAGVPSQAIMALGGWTSETALMYIIGANEETISASRRLGSAAMRFDADGLHAQLGTARLNRNTWQIQE